MTAFSKIILPEEWKDWELKEEIGSGSFGTVYRAVNRDTYQSCAIKVIEIPKDGLLPRDILKEIEEKQEAPDEKKDLDHEKKRARLKEKSLGADGGEASSDLPAGLKGRELLKEIRRREEEEENKKKQLDAEIQSYLRTIVEECRTLLETAASLGDNPHILKIHDSIIQEHTEGIGFDLFIRTDLLSASGDSLLAGELSETEVIKLAADLCDALMDCEKKGLIHWDIKPENILITDEGDYVLSDFGIAKALKKTANSLGSSGTLRYTAPEVYQEGRCSRNVDLYSLGILMYVLMNKDKEPFLDMNKPILYFQDRDKAFRKRMEGNEPVPAPLYGSEGLKNIILRLCAYDPGKRYQRAEQLKEDLQRLKENRYVPRRIKTTGARKKKGFRRFGKGIACLALLCLLSAGGYLVWNHYFHKIIDRESCGQGVYCSLDGRGRLTIEGEGNPDTGDYPWMDYTDKIRQITVEDGVTEIADGMFKDCESLEAVHLGSTLKRIGREAFSGCSALSDIEFPEKMEYIKPLAFASTPWLANQDRPYIIIDHNLLSYDPSKGGTEAVIPEETEEIAAYAFAENEELKSVTLSSGLLSIDQEAFSGCPNIENIDLSDNKHISRADLRVIARNTVWYQDQYGSAALVRTFVSDLKDMYASGNKAGLISHYSKQLKRYDSGLAEDSFDSLGKLDPDSYEFMDGKKGSSYLEYDCGDKEDKTKHIVVFREYGEWVYAGQPAFEKNTDQLALDAIE